MCVYSIYVLVVTIYLGVYYWKKIAETDDRLIYNLESRTSISFQIKNKNTSINIRVQIVSRLYFSLSAIKLTYSSLAKKRHRELPGCGQEHLSFLKPASAQDPTGPRKSQGPVLSQWLQSSSKLHKINKAAQWNCLLAVQQFSPDTVFFLNKQNLEILF